MLSGINLYFLHLNPPLYLLRQKYNFNVESTLTLSSTGGLSLGCGGIRHCASEDMFEDIFTCTMFNKTFGKKKKKH